MTEEREIDLKQLLLVVLMQKKLIILACILGCIAGIVYGAMKTPAPTAPAGEDTVEQTQQAIETYLTEKRTYDFQKAALERQIVELSELMGNLEIYLRESPAMAIDPYHASCAYAELYVIRDGAPMLTLDKGVFEGATLSPELEALIDTYRLTLPTETARILNAYSMSILRENGALDTVAKALDTERTYLRDLVLCKVENNAAVLNITAIGPDSAFADKLLDGVLEMIETSLPGIREQHGDHETVLIRHAPVEEPSEYLLKGQQAVLFSATEYRRNISTVQTELNTLEEPTVPVGIVVSEVSDGTASVETVSVSSGGIHPRQLAKFGGIGLVGGLFASLVLLALYYILTNRVLSAEEFNNRYRMRAITMLPGAKQSGAKCGIAMHGRDSAYLRMSEDEQYEVAKANLSVYAPDVKDIILTGSIPAPQLQRLAESLEKRIDGVRFAAAANINEDASALQALKAHEHVIVVEECLASNYGETDRAYQTLRDWDKKIIGSIMLG